jgi:hypothetical protein
MPASVPEFRDAFESLIGTSGEERTWYGEDAAGYVEWMGIFEETGIDFDSSAETIDAFENFLIAFYPQSGVSGDDWRALRGEFYDMYDIDDHNIDWEAWREALGY